MTASHLFDTGRRPLLALLATTLLVTVVLPWTPLYGVVICPFRLLSELPCPGCGLGRGFCLISRGEISAAFEANPLSPVLYLGVVTLLAHGSLEWVLKRPLPPLLSSRSERAMLILLAAIAITLWLLRLGGLLPGVWPASTAP